MPNRILLGVGRRTVPIPKFLWRRLARAAGRRARTAVAFMTEDHHRVRDLAVLELARTGAALAPAVIAERLSLSSSRVGDILDELEKRLTFLYRSRGEEVTWAYPVTVETTPHHATFSAGEQAYSP